MIFNINLKSWLLKIKYYAYQLIDCGELPKTGKRLGCVISGGAWSGIFYLDSLNQIKIGNKSKYEVVIFYWC